MTDILGSSIKATVGVLMDLYYLEAETSDYPFCVYDRTITEHRTKDGVYKIQSECTFDIVSDTFAGAKEKTSELRQVIENDLGDNFIVKFLSETPDCVDDIWTIETKYNIYQIS